MILVAGSGYVGALLAGELAAASKPIVALSRTAGQTDAGVPVLACDISDPAAVTSLEKKLPATPDTVIHCASSGRGGADAYRAVYLQGAKNLATAFPDARLLFTSSTSVYAQTDGSWVDEDSPSTPTRETGQILLETERFITGKGGTVLRLGGIYGPGRSVILKRFLEGLSAIDSTPTTPSGRYLNQAHRSDIVSALIHLASTRGAAGEIYNVTDNCPLTQLELYTVLAERFDKPLPAPAPPDKSRKRGWTHKRISNRKLRSLGWEPGFPSYLDALAADPLLVPSIQAQVSTD